MLRGLCVIRRRGRAERTRPIKSPVFQTRKARGTKEACEKREDDEVGE